MRTLNQILITLVLISAIVTWYNLVVLAILKIKCYWISKHFDVGSPEYLKAKEQLEECIKSGEINHYFEGFQFTKTDIDNDSTNIKDVQISLCNMSKTERLKLKLYGIKLVDELRRSNH